MPLDLQLDLNKRLRYGRPAADPYPLSGGSVRYTQVASHDGFYRRFFLSTLSPSRELLVLLIAWAYLSQGTRTA